MNGGAPVHHLIETAGAPIPMLGIHINNPRHILILPPFFEEMNRTRTFLLRIMRGLGARGFATWLPQLPGTGDHAAPTRDARWAHWREGVVQVCAHIGGPLMVASFRGGILLDDAAGALATWRFATVTGEALIRDLARARLLAGKEEAADGAPIYAGGYDIHPDLWNAIDAARPATPERLRTVTLTTDTAPADLHLDGPPLWRRAEPGDAPELAAAIVKDIISWSDICAAS